VDQQIENRRDPEDPSEAAFSLRCRLTPGVECIAYVRGESQEWDDIGDEERESVRVMRDKVIDLDLVIHQPVFAGPERNVKRKKKEHDLFNLQEKEPGRIFDEELAGG
jgi:hypothetical protein